MTEPGALPTRLTHIVDVVPVEARSFQGHRAGAVTRTAANLVDAAVAVTGVTLGYVVWCAARFLSDPRGFSFPAPPYAALLAMWAAVLFAYFSVSWATTGRTYGNHLMGLRVVSFRGERLRWAGALLRAAFCVALPIGLYWVLVSRTNRSLQDMVLRTSVTYDWTSRQDQSTRFRTERP
jgi:uncharacterized RDD family membrane protein YckC